MAAFESTAAPLPVTWPRPATAEAIALAAMLTAFAVMTFAPQVLNDGDTYWHVAAGQWVLAHGQVPHRDVFSYTAFGRPWTAHEWLSEVLMALAYGVAGWAGVAVLYGTAAAAAVGVMADRLKRSLGGLALGATLLLALACSASNAFLRPHMLVAPVIVAWVCELMAAREAARAPRWFMAPLMMLWANLHGSYVFGFLLMAPFGLEALAPEPRAWLKTVRQWGPVTLACVAAVLLTPNGWDGLIHPFAILSMGTLSAIREWAPTSFAKPSPIEITLLLVLFVGLGRGVRVPPWRLALLLLVLHMGLQHGRHLMMLAIVAPLVLAEPLAEALGPPAAAPPVQGRGRFAWLVFGALALMLSAIRLADAGTRPDGEVTPRTALAHVPAALRARPVINSYDFGGYLIFQGVKPFIDGRNDLYGDAHVARFMRIEAGDAPSLEAAVRQYGVAWTLLQPGEPLVRALDANPGWRRLYADRSAVVHERIAPAAPDGQAAANR